VRFQLKEQTTPASLAFFDESLGRLFTENRFVSAGPMDPERSTPNLGIWHNQAQGKSTVDSWVGKFGWWKKYVTKCPMDLVGKSGNTIVPWIFLGKKTNQTPKKVNVQSP